MPPPKGCYTLFVHNLPYAARETDIATAFSKFGSVADDHVRIVRNSVTRHSKGFAYVDFESTDALEKFLTCKGNKPLAVGGRLVRLDYDTGHVKGSFRTQSGRLWSKEHKRQKV